MARQPATHFRHPRPFVGLLRRKGPLDRECFNASRTPTQDSHGHRYHSVLGPFKTSRGAEFARANPYVAATVAEYERMAKEHNDRNSKGVRHHGSRD